MLFYYVVDTTDVQMITAVATEGYDNSITITDTIFPLWITGVVVVVALQLA